MSDHAVERAVASSKNRLPPARRLRQAVAMAYGVVKWFKAGKGTGAIRSAELPPGRDAWVHFSVI